MSLDIKQDKLSEATVLRGHMEAVLGDRDEQITQTATLRRHLTEEQNQRKDEAQVIMQRLEHLEQELPGAAISKMERPMLMSRIEAIEATIRTQASMAMTMTEGRLGSEDATVLMDRMDLVENKATNRLETLITRVDKVEQLASRNASFDAAKSTAAMMARLETVEALCLRAEDSSGRASTRGTAAYRGTSARSSTAVDDGGMGDDHYGSRGHSASSTDEIQRALEKVTRRFGEMDAEIKVEMGNRVRALSSELRGEILSEMNSRAGSAEARADAIETRLGEDLQRLSTEVGVRIGKLEGAQLGPRLGRLEEESRRHAKQLLQLVTDAAGPDNGAGDGTGQRQAAATAIEAIEQDVRRRMLDNDGLESEPGVLDASKKSVASPVSNRREMPTSSATAERGRVQKRPSTSSVGGQPKVGFAGDGHSDNSASTTLDEATADANVELPALSDGLRQSLDGLVNAVHRTLSTSQKYAAGIPSPKSGGAVVVPPDAVGSEALRGGGSSGYYDAGQDGDVTHRGPGHGPSSSPMRRITAQLDADLGSSFPSQPPNAWAFGGSVEAAASPTAILSRAASPIRSQPVPSVPSPIHSRAASPMQRAVSPMQHFRPEADVGVSPTASSRMWAYSGVGTDGVVREASPHRSEAGGPCSRRSSVDPVNQTWHGSPLDMGTSSGHASTHYPPGVGAHSPLRGGARSSSIEGGMGVLGPTGSADLASWKAPRGLSREMETGASPCGRQQFAGGVSVLRARATYGTGAPTPQAGSVQLPPGAVPNRGRSQDMQGAQSLSAWLPAGNTSSSNLKGSLKVAPGNYRTSPRH